MDYTSKSHMNYWNGIRRYGPQNRDGPNFNTSCLEEN